MKVHYFFLILILFTTYQTFGFLKHTDQYASRILTPYISFNLASQKSSISSNILTPYISFNLASQKSSISSNINTNSSNINTNTTTKNEQKKEFVWPAFTTESFEKPMTIHFACDRNNHINISLIDHGQPDFVKGQQAIVRMVTGNFPPSRRGYKKFIYTGQFLSDGKTFPIRKRDIKYFLEELNILRSQVFKNKEIGMKEYNEKINYCNSLPKARQQLCYNSAGGYQVKEPHIIIWIVAEETRHPAGKYGVFDPKPLKDLQNLSCYETI